LTLDGMLSDVHEREISWVVVRYGQGAVPVRWYPN
jgi:hypothetical protein